MGPIPPATTIRQPLLPAAEAMVEAIAAATAVRDTFPITPLAEAILPEVEILPTLPVVAMVAVTEEEATAAAMAVEETIPPTLPVVERLPIPPNPLVGAVVVAMAAEVTAAVMVAEEATLPILPAVAHPPALPGEERPLTLLRTSS